MAYRVAIVGATGRTGGIVDSILRKHSYVDVVARTSRGEEGYLPLNIDKEEEVAYFMSLKPEIAFVTIDGDDVVKQYVEKFRERCPDMRIIDLSTAYRTHPDFVYGLPELPGRREEIKKAKLVTNPGCYATSAILAAAPVLKKYGDETEIVIIDGVSSHTGAGKKAEDPKRDRPKYENNILPYATLDHKHRPEIGKEYGKLAGRAVRFGFYPSAVWVDPAILNTLKIITRKKFTNSGLFELYSEFYRNERFVRVISHEPSAKDVRDTNYVEIYPVWDNKAELVVVRSTIDNLVKGAGGQAVQNMIIMLRL